jgi:hypothetical protein
MFSSGGRPSLATRFSVTVPADHQLERAPGGAQAGLHRRPGHVDDGGIGLRHEGADQQHAEQQAGVDPALRCVHTGQTRARPGT